MALLAVAIPRATWSAMLAEALEPRRRQPERPSGRAVRSTHSVILKYKDSMYSCMYAQDILKVEEQLPRSALTLYTSQAVPIEVLEDLLRSLAGALDGRLSPHGSSILPTLYFPTGHSSLRATIDAPARAAEEITALLATPVASSVRLENACDGEGPAIESEVAMLYAASALVRQFGGVAYDDVGVVYDPDELEILGQRGAAREEFFAIRVAAAEASAVHSGFAGTKVQRPFDSFVDTSRCELPCDACPDVVFGRTAVYGIDGVHLPLVELTRILLAAGHDERVNKAGYDVAILGPDLEADDRELLGRLGVASYVSQAALSAGVGDAAIDVSPPVRASRRRDELALLIPLVSDAGRIRSMLECFMRGLRTAAFLATNPAIPREMELLAPDDAFEPRLPSRLAFFRYPQAQLDVYRLELDQAHPVLRAFCRQEKLEAVVGQAVASVVLLELREMETEPGNAVSQDYFRADALSVSLAQRFSSSALAVAIDASGAIYGADELMRLGTVGLGRALSWSRRVAAARHSTTK